MLTFDKERRIAAEHYDEPFARDGWEDDVVSLVTPQRVADEEARGLVVIGGCWIVVDRGTGAVDEWPHLDHLNRVSAMRVVSA